MARKKPTMPDIPVQQSWGLLNYAQAAAYLALAEGTLRNKISEGIGPRFVKIGRACRFRPFDLDAFITSKQVETEQREQRKRRRSRGEVILLSETEMLPLQFLLALLLLLVFALGHMP